MSVRKFEFEHSFDSTPLRHLGVVPPAGPPPAPPPSFSLDELAAAREMAFGEGKEAGIHEAESSIERTLADAVGRLGDVIEQARLDHIQIVDAAHRQAAETMLRLVTQMFPSLRERQGTAEIEQLIDQALRDGFSQPRLIIRCGAMLRDQVDALSANAARRAGYAGQLSVLADPALDADDCRIDWVEGGLERRSADAMNDIMTTLRAALAEHAAPAQTIEEFAT